MVSLPDGAYSAGHRQPLLRCDVHFRAQFLVHDPQTRTTSREYGMVVMSDPEFRLYVSALDGDFVIWAVRHRRCEFLLAGKLGFDEVVGTVYLDFLDGTVRDVGRDLHEEVLSLAVIRSPLRRLVADIEAPADLIDE